MITGIKWREILPGDLIVWQMLAEKPIFELIVASEMRDSLWAIEKYSFDFYQTSLLIFGVNQKFYNARSGIIRDGRVLVYPTEDPFEAIDKCFTTKT